MRYALTETEWLWEKQTDQISCKRENAHLRGTHTNTYIYIHENIRPWSRTFYLYIYKYMYMGGFREGRSNTHTQTDAIYAIDTYTFNMNIQIELPFLLGYSYIHMCTLEVIDGTNKCQLFYSNQRNWQLIYYYNTIGLCQMLLMTNFMKHGMRNLTEMRLFQFLLQNFSELFNCQILRCRLIEIYSGTTIDFDLLLQYNWHECPLFQAIILIAFDMRHFRHAFACISCRKCLNELTTNDHQLIALHRFPWFHPTLTPIYLIHHQLIDRSPWKISLIIPNIYNTFWSVIWSIDIFIFIHIMKTDPTR